MKNNVINVLVYCHSVYIEVDLCGAVFGRKVPLNRPHNPLLLNTSKNGRPNDILNYIIKMAKWGIMVSTIIEITEELRR